MNLVIDVGNTKIKIGIFYLNQLIFFKKTASLNLQLLQQILNNYNINASIIAASGNFDNAIKDFLKEKTKFIDFNHETNLPIINKYATPKTLGLDRICNIIGAKNLAKTNSNILTIDTGTCITFNFLDKTNQFLGGSISPGIKLRFEAMHHFTAKLPLISYDFNGNETINLIGTDTNSSMKSGVINGICAEIEQMISNYKNKYENLTLFMTGGSKHIFEKRIKSEIFAFPHLVIFGLNKILEHNVEKP